MNNKIVVLAIDGLHLKLIQPWMNEGRLSNLKKIVDHGVSGKLRSTVPPLTPTAWSSFVTGKNPGKHGVYYFTFRDEATDRHIPVNATLRSGKTVWDILGDIGKKVLVINMPITYPPSEVNGVMISGFLTPSGKKDFAYPQSIVAEIENRFGEYPLYIKTPIFSANLSKSSIEAFLQELNSEVEYKFKVTHYLLDNFDADFTTLHIWGTDRIQHELWDLIDSSHPKYNRELGPQYREQIIDYFSHLDAEIGKLKNRMDDNTSLFIMSDHGFGPIHKIIDLNSWLLEEGYIKIKKSLPSQLKLILWKNGLSFAFLLAARLFIEKTLRSKGIVKRMRVSPGPYYGIKSLAEKKQMLLSMEDIDWSQTKAYCKPGLLMGAIIINVEGREPKGCVKLGEEYESGRNEIVEKLRQLRDPTTGEAIGGEIYKKEEIYHGPHFDEAPDIVFLPMENKYLPTNYSDFICRKYVMDNIVWMGNHVMDGLFVGTGKNLKEGEQIKGANIIDLAPTFLYLMGEKIPSDMDGKVLKEIFTEKFLMENEIEFVDEKRLYEKEAQVLSKEEEEELLKRLKAWGYLT